MSKPPRGFEKDKSESSGHYLIREIFAHPPLAKPVEGNPLPGRVFLQRAGQLHGNIEELDPANTYRAERQ